MILPSQIEAAVVQMLANAATVGGQGVHVERDAPLPGEPVLNGWVGVYHERMNLPPRALGMGAGSRKQVIGLAMIIQASHAASGADCSDTLDDLLNRVLDVILDDPTITGLAQTLDDAINVDYKLYDKSSSLFVQEALVRFSVIV